MADGMVHWTGRRVDGVHWHLWLDGEEQPGQFETYLAAKQGRVEPREEPRQCKDARCAEDAAEVGR